MDEIMVQDTPAEEMKKIMDGQVETVFVAEDTEPKAEEAVQ